MIQLKIKQVSYLVIIVAVTATVTIGIHAAGSPLSAAACGLIGLTASPYACLAIVTKWVSRRRAIITVAILTFLICGFGVWGLVDAMYIHPDAQGGLVFIVAPMWQWLLLLLSTLPVYLLNRAKSRA